MDPLFAAAQAARLRAYAPHSKFLVGAALEAEDGQVFTGCNVENASYGLTICAERVAIFKAISEGAPRRSFKRLLVCAATPTPTPPCGACRQIIWEFCGNIPVILQNPAGERREMMMLELLPEPFDDTFLG